MKRKPLTNKDGEVRELTDEDFRHFRPAREVLPEIFGREMAAKLLRGRGPQKAPTKQAVSLRLSPEVLSFFRAKGKGWQTRIDETLKAIVLATK